MTDSLPLFRGDSDNPAPGEFLRAADQIGAEFVRDAVWSGGRCNWMGWQMKPLDGYFQPAYGGCGLSIYDGLAGIALFLSSLTQFTGDPYQLAVLHGALRQMLHNGEKLDAPGHRGFYSGFAGVAYALAHVGDAIGDPDLVETGLAWMGRALAAPATHFDVLSGAAGLIVPAIDLASRFDRPGLVDLAEGQARSLVNAAVLSHGCASWPTPGGDGPNLLGYSHGTAGIAWAMLELAEVRKDARYRETATQALEYERSLFHTEEGNWPDLREQQTNSRATPGYPVAWCHGAGGIGLARLRLLERRRTDGRLLGEVDAALRRVSADLASPKAPENSDFTYCHGMAGNAEFLLETALQWGRNDIRTAVANIGQFGIDHYQSKGLAWPCGLRTGEVRGLMLGVAGIGYFYLRLHDPARVPGLLLVQPRANREETGAKTHRQSAGGVFAA